MNKLIHEIFHSSVFVEYSEAFGVWRFGNNKEKTVKKWFPWNYTNTYIWSIGRPGNDNGCGKRSEVKNRKEQSELSQFQRTASNLSPSIEKKKWIEIWIIHG